MASINEKLNYINETKSLIKDKLNDLGSEIEDETTFREYAEKIEDLYNEWPKINDEDTTITLNNTKKGKMNLQLKGNTSQNGTPTPSSPIPVNIVNGDNTITISNQNGTDSNTYNIDLRIGKNLFDINTIIKGYELNGNTGAIQVNATWWTSQAIKVKPNTSYTSSNISSNTKCWYDENGTFISKTSTQAATSPANAKYLRVNGTISSIESEPNAMIEEGNSVTTFEAYNSIELCKIGNYQDYFYKDSGKWYLPKKIGKYVFNSTSVTSISTYWLQSKGVYGASIPKSALGLPNNSLDVPSLCTSAHHENRNWIVNNNDYNFTVNDGSLFFFNDSWDTKEKANTALNGAILYYVLPTSTNTEITYQPLIDQLNELEKAISYEEQTNISQVNNNLSFIINATALMKKND